MVKGVAPIGVLALQGDFAAHARALEEVGAEAREVRRPEELAGLAGLVIPGGESTALLRLMEPYDFEAAVVEFARAGGALLGTCAGLILLAREVTAPPQRSLALLDCVVERNAYGRQVDSFVGRGEIVIGAAPEEIEMVFIRAPRIREIGPQAAVLARHAGEPVAIESARVIGATFHPELSSSRALHQRFVQLAAS